MRIRFALCALMCLPAFISAQAQQAYRCTDPSGSMVFQDRPCSSGFSAPVRMAPPAAPSPRAMAVPEAGVGEEAGVEEDAPPPKKKTGHDNVQEYLQSRERERAEQRAEQRRAFADQDDQHRRSTALSRIDERLRVLNQKKTSLVSDSQERSRATFDEQRLQRLRARVEAGTPGAVDEAISTLR